MRFTPTRVDGAYLVDLDARGDGRGFFARMWCRDELEAQGLEGGFVQTNNALSESRGTLRGLHYQVAPHEEVKLVRCVRGAIFDVVVDVRPQSPTYLSWMGAELTSENRRMMNVPRGCAHGLMTLVDATEVIYSVSHPYTPDAERGIRWDDPRFGIVWPDVGTLTISEKDRQWPDFAA
jgi:dTDP-4-dehydrorhamnose 3,5-epimerase